MININFRDPRPIYEQVRDSFRQLILSGVLPPAYKMPSVRELASQLAINPNTIQRAYRELEKEGYICSVPGRGSFVCKTDSAVEARKKELLEKLRAAGKTVAVATSKPQEMAELLLRREGMDALFHVICGSSPDGNNNAKWQVVTRAMEHCGAKPESTILVGDTKYDVQGAHKVGIACVGVRYGYAAEGELEAAGADYIVRDIPELERLLLG